MSKQHKYLVTTDADTGEVIRVEQLGTTGELVEVPADTLPGLQAADRPGTAPALDADDGEREYAPGVFIESGMREPAGEEEAAGIFVAAELPEPGLPETRAGAPAFFGAELPEARADAPAES